MTAAEMRAKLSRHGIRSYQVARELPMDASALSRILNEHMPMPDGFPAQFAAAFAAAAQRRASELIQAAQESLVSSHA